MGKTFGKPTKKNVKKNLGKIGEFYREKKMSDEKLGLLCLIVFGSGSVALFVLIGKIGMRLLM